MQFLTPSLGYKISMKCLRQEQGTREQAFTENKHLQAYSHTGSN